MIVGDERYHCGESDPAPARAKRSNTAVARLDQTERHDEKEQCRRSAEVGQKTQREQADDDGGMRASSDR